MPTFHFGRMVDHVHLRVRDIEASRRFYLGALASLGLEPGMQGDGYFQIDELFVSADGPPTSNLHLAFQTTSREEVDRWHEAALAAGGRDNGAPGERPYHPGYYAAYVLDPDGNNIEAVHHGDAKRSAASVEIEVELPG
jgi:catechol 2,3-dioxygenase-like lactoylglutathione lyase family enzyme